MSNVPRRSNSTNPRAGVGMFPFPVRPTTNNSNMGSRPQRSNTIPPGRGTESQQQRFERRYERPRVEDASSRDQQQYEQPSQPRPNPGQSMPSNPRPGNGPRPAPAAGVDPRANTSQKQRPRQGPPPQQKQGAQYDKTRENRRSVPPDQRRARKLQMNQTLAMAMMTSPVNVVPFPLPIPLGITTLLMGQANR